MWHWNGNCDHFGEIFIPCCTGSCPVDSFQYGQWRKFRQNNNISVSMNGRQFNCIPLYDLKSNICSKTCLHLGRSIFGARIALRQIYYLKLLGQSRPLGCGRWNWAMEFVEVEYIHDDAIKWKHFPRYWPFVRGIHRSPVNSPHKGQWRGALMFS